MFEKIYQKSEIWFAVMWIGVYVVSNSIFLQLSERTGLEMVLTIPCNLVLLGLLFTFIRKNSLNRYYGLHWIKCSAETILYGIPLLLIATVNLWAGIHLSMKPLNALIYFSAMLLTGIIEELLFRGLLFKAMSRDNLCHAVVLTSILFGSGHIVNLINGNSTDPVSTICQLFYAVAIGFLLAAVLYASKSILPCIMTHSMLNALSTFSNDSVLDAIQVPISLILCVISGISAWLILRKSDFVWKGKSHASN